MTDYKLYSIAGSCSTGITVLMEKLKLDFEVIQRKDVDNYDTISPTNKVPALQHNDKIITEGAAIALYLLESNKNDLLPSNDIDRARFYEWLMFCYATIHPAYAKAMSARTNKVSSAYIQKLADQISAIWKIVNDELQDKKYILGNKVCHADYMIAIYTSWGNKAYKIKLGKNVKRLAKEVSNLPEFKSAYKKEEVEFKIFY